MSIKPVLVPDHDAAGLRALMDSFAEAATGPTRQELTESRSAVAAARKTITEGSISDLLNQDPTSPKFNDHPGASQLKKAKDQPKPYPALKNTRTGKVRPHPNDPDQGVTESSPRDLDHMPGKTIKHQNTNCTTCHGSKSMYKLDGKLFADNKKGAVRVKCPACKGTGDKTGVAEGVNYTDELRDKMQWLMTTYHMRSGEAEEAAYYDKDPATWKGSPWEDEYTDSAKRLSEFAPSNSGDDGGDDDGFDEDTLRKLAAQWFAGDEDPQVERLLAAAGWEIGQDEGYDDEPGVFVVQSGDDNGRSYISWPAEELRSDVAEARPDVMRHGGDKTIRVVKKGGKPIGEIGIDAEASPGNGAYYVKLYDGSYDAVGFDSAEEALAELKYAVKQMSEGVAEASPTGVFKQGDKVKVHGKYNGTVVGQDGDTYYVQIDGQPGSQAVSAASLANPAAGGFKPGTKLMYKGQPVTYIRPFAQDPGQSYVKIASGSDELVATADLQAATVAESIDPVEQLRADIRRFAR